MNRTESNRLKSVRFSSVTISYSVQTGSILDEPKYFRFNSVLPKTEPNRTVPTPSDKFKVNGHRVKPYIIELGKVIQMGDVEVTEP